MFSHVKRTSTVGKRQDGQDGWALEGGWSGHPTHGDIKGNMLPGLKISIQYPSGSWMKARFFIFPERDHTQWCHDPSSVKFGWETRTRTQRYVQLRATEKSSTKLSLRDFLNKDGATSAIHQMRHSSLCWLRPVSPPQGFCSICSSLFRICFTALY